MAKTPKEALVVVQDTALIPAARYLGEGHAFVAGVPMRDLSADEWAALGDDLRRICLATQLYTTDDAPAADAPPAAQEG